MLNIHKTVRRCFLAVVTFTSFSPLVGAQTRTEITINASQAEPWIQAATVGLNRVLGVLAHEETNTLWVCNNNTGGGRDGSPVVGQTGLRSFDLKSGAPKGTYPFPTNGGTCNDIAVSSNGTVYATETFANRIHRLRPGAAALDVWIEDPKQLAAVDGVAILADGAVYVNTFFNGQLLRIPVNADGSAGTIVDAAEPTRWVAIGGSIYAAPGRGSGTRRRTDSQRRSRGGARVAGRVQGHHRGDRRRQHRFCPLRKGQGRRGAAMKEGFTLTISICLSVAVVHAVDWPHPVISDRRLYVRNQGTLLVCDIKATTP